MAKSLRYQLSLYLMAIVLLMVSGVSFLANMALNQQFESHIILEEQGQRQKIVSDLENLYNGMTRSWNTEYLHAIGMYSLYDGYVLTVTDAAGKEIWDAQTHDMSLCRQIMTDITERMAQRTLNGGFTTYSYDLMQGSQKIGTANIKAYGPYFLADNEYQFINTLNVLLLAIAGASCVLAMVAGAFFAHRIARPITKTAEIAQQISNGNYNIRFESETKTTELSTLIASINEMAATLDRQERHRKQLTADMAHELRTPLAAIRSYLEAMAEGLWEPTPQRLNSCVDEVKRLSSLVADLEGLARLEQDNLVLNLAEIDLFEVVRAVCTNFETQAFHKQIKLELVGAPLWVLADKDRATQVVTNLMSNAIKYTPENGRVVATVREEGQNAVFSLCDNGMGIAPADVPFVFERFYRTDQSRNRKTGGSGIGLTIAKSIVEAHGGQIWVESTAGEGSCFFTVWPKGAQAERLQA